MDELTAQSEGNALKHGHCLEKTIVPAAMLRNSSASKDDPRFRRIFTFFGIRAAAELQARLRVGQRVLDLQDELRRARDILAAERDLIENIILEMRTSKRFDPTSLRQLQSPVEKTSGDILLSAFRPDQAQHLMLGDFTGHGLPAAIGGPIVSDIFYTMTAKGLPMATIISELNRQLCEKMPTGLFLAAILIELDPDRCQLNVWNCSMQEILIFRHHCLWQTVP
ncbi:MAG: SpoIIE family protein phosphatase, partial [Gammaproteobacteria bacterium]|nr:SpoIIE family protein phosphatase [Gammaproteobacteria bacterium]